jgi:carbonic anhydrase
MGPEAQTLTCTGRTIQEVLIAMDQNRIPAGLNVHMFIPFKKLNHPLISTLFLIDWGNIYPTCIEDPYQSPANLALAQFAHDLPIPSYRSDGCDVWIQGVDYDSFEVQFGAAGCKNLIMDYIGKTFYLDSMHFHSPSEHTVGGGHYSADAHMIHRELNGDSFVIVGIFLDVTINKIGQSNNSFFDEIWTHGGSTVSEISTEKTVTDSALPLNPYDSLFPGDRKFYNYLGSLTTPPCSAGAHWIHYEAPVPISDDDLNILRSSLIRANNSVASVYGNNNRPKQAINGRTIYFSDGIPSAGDDDDDSNSKDGMLYFSVTSSVVMWAFMIGILIHAFVKKRKTKLDEPLMGATNNNRQTEFSFSSKITKRSTVV